MVLQHRINSELLLTLKTQNAQVLLITQIILTLDVTQTDRTYDYLTQIRYLSEFGTARKFDGKGYLVNGVMLTVNSLVVVFGLSQVKAQCLKVAGGVH